MIRLAHSLLAQLFPSLNKIELNPLGMHNTWKNEKFREVKCTDQGCRLAVATRQMRQKYSPGDLMLEGYMPRGR